MTMDDETCCVVAAGDWQSPVLWVFVCGAVALVSLGLAAVACWIRRRRNSLAHKLGKLEGREFVWKSET